MAENYESARRSLQNLQDERAVELSKQAGRLKDEHKSTMDEQRRSLENGDAQA